MFLGVNTASINAQLITGNFHNSKERKFNVKQVDSKTSRVAMNWAVLKRYGDSNAHLVIQLSIQI